MGITPINIGGPGPLQAQQALQAGLIQPAPPQASPAGNDGKTGEKDGLPPGHGGTPPGHGGTPPGLAKKTGKGKGGPPGKMKAGKEVGGQQVRQQPKQPQPQQQMPPEFGLLQALMSMVGSTAGPGGANGPMQPLSLLG